MEALRGWLGKHGEHLAPGEVARVSGLANSEVDTPTEMDTLEVPNVPDIMFVDDGDAGLVTPPPAQRGTPQIEVTFDLDANGILKVKAVDKGTGKEHEIRIEASSGLSEEEVERMKHEAEANADTDKAKRELVDLKNQVDSMVHETDKQLEEHKDKLEEADITAINEAKVELQKAAESEDKEAIEAALTAFQTKAQKLGEIIYKQSQDEQAVLRPPAVPPRVPATTNRSTRTLRSRARSAEDLEGSPSRIYRQVDPMAQPSSRRRHSREARMNAVRLHWRHSRLRLCH